MTERGGGEGGQGQAKARGVDEAGEEGADERVGGAPLAEGGGARFVYQG